MIGTSTKVDISGVNVEKFDDKYFAKEADKKKKKGEGEFFEAEKEVSYLLPFVSIGIMFFFSSFLIKQHFHVSKISPFAFSCYTF